MNIFDFRALVSNSSDLSMESTLYKVTNKEVSFSSYSIPVRIYYPTDQPDLPVIYHIHGGAWVAGNLDSHDKVCRHLAKQTQSVVIAIHYRRPPEFPFPTAVNDCYAVLQWIHDNKVELQMGDPLILLGDSAGAGLVTSVCYMNRKAVDPIPIRSQILINPALDLRRQSHTYRTYQHFLDTYLTAEINQNDSLIYPFGKAVVKGMPPTAIVIGEKDEIKEDGIMFYQQLLLHQIPSTLFEQKGIGHFEGQWTDLSSAVFDAMEFVKHQIIDWR